jgi:hypothetical protein
MHKTTRFINKTGVKNYRAGAGLRFLLSLSKQNKLAFRFKIKGKGKQNGNH